MWNNAMIYNGPGHEVHAVAQRLSEFFEQYWARWERNWQMQVGT